MEIRKRFVHGLRQTLRCTLLSPPLQLFEIATNKSREVICMVHCCIFYLGGIIFFTEFAYRVDFYTNEYFPTNKNCNSSWIHIYHPRLSVVLLSSVQGESEISLEMGVTHFLTFSTSNKLSFVYADVSLSLQV